MDINISKLIGIASSQVGVREGEIDNTGPRIVDYQGATWMTPGPWPWCAAFMAWVMREWLQDGGVRAALQLENSSAVERWRCRDASAFGWEKWAKEHNILMLSEDNLAKAGDFVVYDFSHIGMVYEDQLKLSADIKTIEGNTHPDSKEINMKGDGVWKKERHPKLTRSYIRVFI